MRHYSVTDQIIFNVDNVIQTLLHSCGSSTRPNPSVNLQESYLNEKECRHIAALMRVNHVGEVCAQALYLGQALTAKTPDTHNKLKQAAQEEKDHLTWCRERIHELNNHTSYLVPVWYTTALFMGMLAGLAGDKMNLGFLAETEHQVEKHLKEHLNQLPLKDFKTRAIVEQMLEDEKKHALMAEQAGAMSLPASVKFLMQFSSKIMTTISYWI